MKTKYRETHNIDHTVFLACSALADKKHSSQNTVFVVVEICVLLNYLNRNELKQRRRVFFEK
jgi:hypothetical protein